jgi:hypothetical protein
MFLPEPAGTVPAQKNRSAEEYLIVLDKSWVIFGIAFTHFLFLLLHGNSSWHCGFNIISE